VDTRRRCGSGPIFDFGSTSITATHLNAKRKSGTDGEYIFGKRRGATPKGARARARMCLARSLPPPLTLTRRLLTADFVVSPRHATTTGFFRTARLHVLRPSNRYRHRYRYHGATADVRRPTGSIAAQNVSCCPSLRSARICSGAAQPRRSATAAELRCVALRCVAVRVRLRPRERGNRRAMQCSLCLA
jgi:hypothetical protein